MLTVGQIVSLTVEKPAAGGAMIARDGRQVVLVAGAIPGERVEARIERVRRDVAHARVIRVEAASPDRRETAIDPQCGGCLYAYIAYPRQLEIKSDVIADAFARVGRTPLAAPVPVTASPESGYRMRARLHARAGRSGFFLEGTHNLCDARATGQLLPALLDTADRVVAAVGRLGFDAPYELEFSENIDASQRVVHVEGAAVGADALRETVNTDGLTGLTLRRGDTRQTRIVTVLGDPHVVDTVPLETGAITLRRHVNAFFQGNRHLLGDLVRYVAAQVPAGSRALDLYAGTGLFSLAAAFGGATVTAVEGEGVAADDLAFNASQANGVTAVHQAVEAFLTSRNPRADVLLVDPPRTGVSAEAMTSAIRTAPARIVYVSCDVATLARDARRLLDSGYQLGPIKAFDMFPNTPHIETVAVFEQSTG